MGFNFKMPNRDEFDTEEDYKEALDLYEWAESDYMDECREYEAIERMNN